MKKIIPIVIVIIAILGFKVYKKSEAGNEIKAQAIEQMQQQYSSVLGDDYIVELVNYAHSDAMDKAYKMGGRRKSDEFDSATYRSVLRLKMAQKLGSDGKHRLAQSLGSGNF